jgi:sigma-B regulation protein RsbU (phosphoserine phosphatase)
MSEPVVSARNEPRRPLPRAAPPAPGTPLRGRWRSLWRGATRALDRIKGASWPIPYVLLSGGLAALLVRAQRRLGYYRQGERVRLRAAEEAREIQLATLTPPPPHPCLETAVRFEPAEEVGGDFYSFFTAGMRLGIILGDASGKGTPAALVSTSICHLAQWLRPMEDPDGFLAKMNRTLLEQLPPETYASMIVALLDPRNGRLTTYNAGHPPGLIVSGATVRHTRQPDLPVGMFPDVQFEGETLPFRPGDTLVLYSDGFTEARNSTGAALSVEGLETLVRRHCALPPEELADRLIEETHAFGTVTDDLTLVVVRYHPR